MKYLALASLGFMMAACPGPAHPDAGTDAADAPTDSADAPVVDSGPVAHVADLPTTTTGSLVGLDGRVDVVIDSYGWPHIYATTIRDVAYVQGLMAARHRMPEMELLRRVASGTLADAFGMLDPGLIDQDIAIRVVGLRRAAEAMWTQVQAGTTPSAMREKAMLEAYTLGVNSYLADIRTMHARTPTGTELVVNPTTPDWSPVDSLVIARYQSYSLSYDGEDDIHLSAFRDAARTTFDMASMTTDPDRFARRGFFVDFWRFAPETNATVVPTFYAGLDRNERGRNRRRDPAIPRSVYASAERVLQLTRRVAEGLGDESRGSNNWVVSAMASATNHALLANDPHLSLSSPSVFWGVHLNVSSGPDAVNVHGVSFPGIPGVVIGYNDSLAWGVTTADYDVTDAFAETITPGAAGSPDTVLHNGTQVPIQTIVEHIPDGLGHGNIVDVPIEIVPHHGPILPTIVNHRVAPRTATTAISIQWTGHQATDELSAFLGLAYAHDVNEGLTAVDNFSVGAQNFVLADTTGQIAYSSSCLLPTRPAAALTWTQANPNGTAPAFVQPGTGEADWNGFVPRPMIPRGLGSAAQRWFATANNDQAGTAQDGNPFNDRVFLASSYDDGFRAKRINDRLAMLNNQAHITDMSSIQGEHTVIVADRYRPFIASALTHLDEEWATPGTHADLSALATSLMARQARIRDAGQRIATWTLDGASGLEMNATDQQRHDAVATTLFHGWIVRFLDLAFGDEFEAMGLGRGAYGSERIRASIFLLEHPDQAITRDAAGQSVLWDDISTATTHESRDAIIVRALDEGLAQLQTVFMTDNVDMWLWGQVHTLTLDSLVPGPGATLSIPPPHDAMFPNGFPRPGGLHVVDASNPGTSDFDFTYGSGPTQRFVVEMDPAGPHAFNALPGGEIYNGQSPHHSDEMRNYWRFNLVHPLPHTEAEVITAFESHYVFTPGH